MENEPRIAKQNKFRNRPGIGSCDLLRLLALKTTKGIHIVFAKFLEECNGRLREKKKRKSLCIVSWLSIVSSFLWKNACFVLLF